MPTIRERVQSKFPDLPPVQKGLIQRILSEYEDFIFLSVDDAARRLEVHKSTLVRLAQSLGYEGYAHMREQLQDLYRQEITPGKKLGRSLADVHEDDLYQQVIETEILYLRESLKTIRTEDIHKAARMLLTARRVFVCGKGPQRLLTDLFEFRLRRFQFDVMSIWEEGRAILEKLQLLTRHDVLVMISFNAFLKEHRDALCIAKEMGTPVVLITDSVAKDMLSQVDLTLAARRGPATIYHTNIVPMAIVSAIILDIARLHESASLASLERLHDLRRRYGYERSLFHIGKSGESPGERDDD